MIDTGRKADLQYLLQKRLHAVGSERQYLDYLIQQIANESKEVKNMRKSLIKAVRNNDVDEIKDIHEYIKNKRRYHNE